jgi:hypothetical protein
MQWSVRLDDVTALDDDQSISQYHRVQRIMGDQQSPPFVPVEMLPEFRADVQRCTGI